MKLNSKIKQGEKVRFDNGVISGEGEINGISTTGAVTIGRGIIIRLTKKIKTYPFSHAVFFENQLERIK